MPCDGKAWINDKDNATCVPHVARMLILKWRYSTNSAVKFMWATCGPHVAIVQCHHKEVSIVMLHCGRLFLSVCLSV